jgi:LmbE family N-acetylglucosaminyl deacetylase
MIEKGQQTRQKKASDYLSAPANGVARKNGLIQDPEVNSNSRVMVLAPHHLDEIIGCGGTMIRLAKRGAHIKVTYLTDSTYDGCVGPYCRLVPMERDEVKESLERLRCFDCEHLEMPCMGISCDKENYQKLAQVIEYYSPDLVFVPSFQEMHPDNMMTGLLAALALREYEGSLTLYSYEVWGGLSPNTMVEITDVIEEKISAMEVERKQGRLVDGERMVREINAFRLTSMEDERYCETFLRKEKKEFVAMARFD